MESSCLLGGPGGPPQPDPSASPQRPAEARRFFNIVSEAVQLSRCGDDQCEDLIGVIKPPEKISPTGIEEAMGEKS